MRQGTITGIANASDNCRFQRRVTCGAYVLGTAPECATGRHNDGTGQCVAVGACNAQYHDDGTGKCVAAGCADGFHDGGGGKCAAVGSCATAFHDDGTGKCISLGGCAAGYRADATGKCAEAVSVEKFLTVSANVTYDYSLSTSPPFTCGGKVDGSVACWGSDKSGTIRTGRPNLRPASSRRCRLVLATHAR